MLMIIIIQRLMEIETGSKMQTVVGVHTLLYKSKWFVLVLNLISQ